MTHHVSLSTNEPENRFELHHGDDRIGQIDYEMSGDVIDLTHTEVDPDHGGKGYAQRLVEHALAHARERELKVKASCPFVASYLDKHEEHADLRA